MASAGKNEGKEQEGGLAKQVHISRKILHGALCVIPVSTSKTGLEGKRTIHYKQQKDLKKQEASLQAFSQQMYSCQTHTAPICQVLLTYSQTQHFQVKY